jgi:HNH endonuclease
MMPSIRREFLLHRAGNRCEYCHMPVRTGSLWGAHVEHIRARQHRGSSDVENCAISCAQCNFVKGPNIAAVDPLTRRIVRLFHPRRDAWSMHFKIQGASIVGLTPIGRATVELLVMNRPSLQRRRQNLRLRGVKFD